MSAVKRRDFVAKNMNKVNRGGVHKSKKGGGYTRKSKYKEKYYEVA